MATKVGIFDSGIGGLSVLSACVRRAPQYVYYYYGDNENAPYGSRSKEEITRFVRAGVRELFSRGVNAVVLACNTATAVCAEQMRAEFPIPVVGMEPAVKPAGKSCERVLVLATPRTAKSKRLGRLLRCAGKSAFTVFPEARLAGAIEAHYTRGEPLDLATELPVGEFDGVVLGCTHYVFLRREISEFYGGIPVFDGVEGTVNRLVSLLNDEKAIFVDHHQPPRNSCRGRVFFVGKGAKINKEVYKSERMFRFC